MAAQLQRPVRENMTPLLLEKVVWCGANLGSYQNASAALRTLSDVDVTVKQVQRITSQVGSDGVARRRVEVERHRARPLMERVAAPPHVQPPQLAVVMMDGGRFQRRDDFRGRRERPSLAVKNDSGTNPGGVSHWREDKVGIVLSMTSEVHSEDPSPEFPEWLAGADVIRELAQLAAQEESATEIGSASADEWPSDQPTQTWPDVAPQLVSREVIASSVPGEEFGWHLEWKAWTLGVPAAPRQAFVADGLAVNWTIHRRHFSQMTGILDLMHALSYAWQAGAVINDPGAYRRYAGWIWQGRVDDVIEELRRHQACDELAKDHDRRARIDRAVTYYENHRHLMNYPAYRQAGLPLTSSHIESTVKLISARVKGSEKFWRRDHGESILQLRADSLSDSTPLTNFWQDWRTQQTGTNRYRKSAA